MNTSAWIEALGWTLIHSIWQAGLIAACLRTLCLAARRSSPNIRYFAACLALIATVVVTAVTFVREVNAAPKLPRTPSIAQLAPSALRGAGPAFSDPSSISMEPSAFPFTAEANSPEAAAPTLLPANPYAEFRDKIGKTLQPFTPTIAFAWLLGVSLFSVRLWRSWRAVRHLRDWGQPCERTALHERFIALRSALRAAAATQFLISAQVRVPMVIGWLKPVVLLPASVLAGLSAAQLEAIIAHELAHIRRHDCLVNLLQNAVETVFFYHPAVWWISRLIREEREHCCDDIAAAATGGARGYVEALAALEQARIGTPDFALAANGGSLLGRARRLLLQKPEEGPAQGLFAGGLVLLGVAALFLIPFALSRAADTRAPGAAETGTGHTAAPGPDEQYHAFDRVKRGDLWPGELLAKLPFGPAHATGLRAAWIFRPMRSEYLIGDSIASRIIIHNQGADPVEFLARRWILDAEWSVSDAKGTRVTPRQTRFARTDDSEQRIRLAPGESVELPTPGLGIGPGDFDEVYGDDRVGVYLPAKPKDEFACKWSISFRGAWALANDEAAATPKPLKLDTGELRFRINAQEPTAPKRVSIAISGGRYILEPGLDLRISRVPMQISGTVNGVPVPSDGKVWEMNWASIDPSPAVIPPGGKVTRRASMLRLPNGDRSYVIAWQRGERTLWIGEADNVRKVDLTVAGKFPLNEVLDEVESAEREKLRELADKFSTGISFPEKKWKRQDREGIEGMPAEIRAALEQHRPNLVSSMGRNHEPQKPVDGAKIYADAERFASSFGPPGSARAINVAAPGLENWSSPAVAEAFAQATVGRFNVSDGQSQPKLPAPISPVFPSTGANIELNNEWRASGRVTDEKGAPLPDVEIWVHAGVGTLFQTGTAKTDANGRYSVSFRPGIQMGKDSSQMQFANITAHKPGWFEKNLNRHGEGAGAMRDVSKDELETFKITREQLVLPDKPREVNFVMAPAGVVKGKLTGTGSFPPLPPQDYRGKDNRGQVESREQRDRSPLSRWRVWLTGPKLPPACSVIGSTETGPDGRFEFKDVPVGFEWQIEVDSHQKGAPVRTQPFKGRPGELSTEIDYNIEKNSVSVAPARNGVEVKVPSNSLWSIQFVEGESGRPIPDAVLSVAFPDVGRDIRPPTKLVSDANGMVRIQVRPRQFAIIEPNVPDRWSSNNIVLGEGARNGNALEPPVRPGEPMKIALWKGTKARGKILLPDGTPLRGAPLSFDAEIIADEWKKRLVPDQSSSTIWSKLAYTREDGGFELTVPPMDARARLRVYSPEIAFGVTAPTWTKVALANCAPFHVIDGGPAGKSLELNGVLDFGERRLQRGVVVRGRVEDAAGKPLSGIGISVSTKPRSAVSRTTQSGPDGAFTLPSMPTGEVEIMADARLLVGGQPPKPVSDAVFIRQVVALPEAATSVDVVVRAEPVIALEFEWIDRRVQKGGPVSAFDAFSVSGQVRDSRGDLHRWSGRMERVKRDGKVFMVAKVPERIVDPMIQLPADLTVTATYEDDSGKYGPGICAILDHTTPKRRIIYGDEPRHER